MNVNNDGLFIPTGNDDQNSKNKKIINAPFILFNKYRFYS